MMPKLNGAVLILVLTSLSLFGFLFWKIENHSQQQMQIKSASLGTQTATPTRTRKVHVARTRAASRPRLRRTRAATLLSQATARLIEGPVVGAVTSGAARIFVRTTISATMQIQYSPTPDLSGALVSAAQMTTADSDFTAQIEIDKLQPSTVYYLNVLVNDTPQLRAPYPRFKSFAPAGSSVRFKFVVLTDLFWKPTMAFRNADAEKPDFVVIGGDFVHNNPTGLGAKRDLFKKRYDPTGRLHDFVSLILNHYALAHFWDDHDIGKDNADKTYAEKGLALRVLKEYFPVYPVSEYGDWQKFSYAQADFFLLDARSQRDPALQPEGPDKSMLDGDQLGDKGQWNWLTRSLLESRARWKFIFSPVPFNPTTSKDDSWRSYTDERTRLVNFIRDNQIQGVIFISGDLHAGGIDNGINSGFPEMVVPSPNGYHCLSAKFPGQWSEGVYVAPRDGPCDGYGVITVSTDPDQVELQVKDSSGTTRLSLQVK